MAIVCVHACESHQGSLYLHFLNLLHGIHPEVSNPIHYIAECNITGLTLYFMYSTLVGIFVS